jgi:hypothetical protein
MSPSDGPRLAADRPVVLVEERQLQPVARLGVLAVGPRLEAGSLAFQLLHGHACDVPRLFPCPLDAPAVRGHVERELHV